MDEAQLIAGAQQLDPEALGEIFDRYHAGLYRYIYLHTHHQQTSEDLTEQVFERLLEALHAGRGPAQYLKAWLYRVAHNLIIDEARRNRLRLSQPLDEEWAADEETEQIADRNLLLRQVRDSLWQINERQRTAIVLRYGMELSNEEVAKSLSLSTGAAKALLHRALRAVERLIRQSPEMEGALYD